MEMNQTMLAVSVVLKDVLLNQVSIVLNLLVRVLLDHLVLQQKYKTFTTGGTNGATNGGTNGAMHETKIRNDGDGDDDVTPLLVDQNEMYAFLRYSFY